MQLSLLHKLCRHSTSHSLRKQFTDGQPQTGAAAGPCMIRRIEAVKKTGNICLGEVLCIIAEIQIYPVLFRNIIRYCLPGHRYSLWEWTDPHGPTLKSGHTA